MMSNPMRLHPVTIVFNLIKGIKDSIFLFVLAFVTLFDGYLLYAILAILVLLTVIFLTSILSWRRFTYLIEGDELRLEYGIFVRKKRFISKNRIQSIDLTQSIIHRIFKLVKVEIETAGTGSEAEASLLAVTLDDGEALRQELKSIRVEEQEEYDKRDYPLQTIDKRSLILAGATSGSVGVLVAIAGFVFSEIERFIPTGFYDNAYKWVVGLGLLVLVLMIIGGLLLLWLLGIAGTVIKYWNFTISKVEDDLIITRGLLEKKQITIPLKRIQAVGFSENIIRQPFGYATVIAEIAGGSNEKGEDFSTVLFPIMKKEEIASFLGEFLADYQTTQSAIQVLPKRARKYYLFRAVIPAIVLVAAVLYFLPQFSWVPILFLIVSIYLGILRHRDGGYSLEGKKLMIQYRLLNKVTMVINHKRIQAFNKKQHFLHKKSDLATLRLSIVGKMGLGKHYTIKELEELDVDGLAEWYSYRKKD
ncbi:PH domain-containing protein [Ornithinibacillus xuwenensis]|uniref:PH domain-containing protein n=1 Tax=Ornithinibacillus xuwenensis TaxID=3144668 RepID=A0ABU9XLS1_9BACI